VRGRTCEQSLASNLTMKQCCCSIGRGWNSLEDEQRRRPCVTCPVRDSRKYFHHLNLTIINAQDLRLLNLFLGVLYGYTVFQAIFYSPLYSLAFY